MIAAARARILVVDDELLNRRLVQAILGPEGHEIVLCESGERALEIVDAGDVALVLLDVMMPGLDGIEVCRRIRQRPEHRLMPVILVSALTDAASRTRGKLAGADDFLTKPIHEDELLVRVRNLLLLRAYFKLIMAQREQAERDARRWKLAAEVATSVASCLDYRSMIDILLARLRVELGIETAALFSGVGDQLEQLASAGSSTCSYFESVPITIGDEQVGVLSVGRTTPFDAGDHDILLELQPHIANAVAHVRSHLSTVSRLLQAHSDREHAAAALRVSEERHRILFDASPHPIWAFDLRSLRLLNVNDAVLAALGYSREELLAMTLRDLQLEQDLPEIERCLAKLVVGDTCKIGVMRYVRKDREVIELDMTSHTMRLAGELVVLAVGVNVTHSRRLEEQLRQSQKMDAIGQLAGGVAHDFNNILAAIMANAELAREDLGDDHPTTTELKEIERAAQRAVVLTRQLLMFSRQQKQQVANVDLNGVVRNLEKMLARIVPEDIQMSTDLASSLGAIEADPGQIEQVLMNLVVNARDAMPEGGRVMIETSEVHLEEPQTVQLSLAPGPYVVLAVSDTGCGMDRATQARIFEPFFTTKPVGKGTGLGLATVFGIVKQSRGAISVYSEPGRGSTFRVYLPRVAAAATSTAAPARLAAKGTGLVLVVEDDAMLRSVIRRQLTSWGYTLLEAPNALRALELLKTITRPVDLLLTDLVLPGIDGRALARRVVAEHPTTKVLFMSGYTEHAAVKTAALETDVHFIEKPFSGHVLSTTIQRALAG